ncbi:MAG TPA: hypothetical protein VF546_06250 [Pyrinomonadaceae bacterium]|jgi:hypothetical protein
MAAGTTATNNTLHRLWQRRLVRVLAGLSVFAAALGVQYYLTSIPVPAELAETGRFTPAVLPRGQQELIIEGPEVNSPDGTLLAHAGAPQTSVDVRFERARVDEQTAQLLTALGDTLPDAPGPVAYVPRASGDGAPCRTLVTVGWADPQRPPATIRLFQLEAPGLDRYRDFEMQAEGGDLAVQLLPKAETETATVARGCQNLLTIGALEEPIEGEAGLTIVAAAGSAFRWHFRPRKQGSVPWGDAAGVYEPFTLGAAQTQRADRPPLSARAVRVRALDAPPDAPDILNARSADGRASLNLADLKLGSDQLQLNITGNAWVKIDGADRTVNVFERVERYPLTSALLAAANSALLAWIAHALFAHRKPDPTPEPATHQNQ